MEVEKEPPKRILKRDLYTFGNLEVRMETYAYIEGGFPARYKLLLTRCCDVPAYDHAEIKKWNCATTKKPH